MRSTSLCSSALPRLLAACLLALPTSLLAAQPAPTELQTARESIVILTTQEDGSRAALIVDQIMEQRQVVIKGLNRNFGPVPGVAAATILGDGQVALILDPSDLTHPASPPAEADT